MIYAHRVSFAISLIAAGSDSAINQLVSDATSGIYANFGSFSETTSDSHAEYAPSEL